MGGKTKMEMKQYLDLTAELANPETLVARRTEILTELTEDYKETTETVSNLSNEKEEMDKQIKDLTHSHSIMFRKLGMQTTQVEEEVKQQEYAETINLNMIEKGL